MKHRSTIVRFSIDFAITGRGNWSPVRQMQSDIVQLSAVLFTIGPFEMQLFIIVLLASLEIKVHSDRHAVIVLFVEFPIKLPVILHAVIMHFVADDVNPKPDPFMFRKLESSALSKTKGCPQSLGAVIVWPLPW